MLTIILFLQLARGLTRHAVVRLMGLVRLDRQGFIRFLPYAVLDPLRPYASPHPRSRQWLKIILGRSHTYFHHLPHVQLLRRLDRLPHP